MEEITKKMEEGSAVTLKAMTGELIKEKMEMSYDRIRQLYELKNIEIAQLNKLLKTSQNESASKTETIKELRNNIQVSQEEIKTLITSKDIVSIIEKPASKTSPGPDGSTGKFYQSFKEELTRVFLKLLQNKR